MRSRRIVVYRLIAITFVAVFLGIGAAVLSHVAENRRFEQEDRQTAQQQLSSLPIGNPRTFVEVWAVRQDMEPIRRGSDTLLRIARRPSPVWYCRWYDDGIALRFAPAQANGGERDRAMITPKPMDVLQGGSFERWAVDCL